MDARFLLQHGQGLGFVQSSLKDRRGYDRLGLPSERCEASVCLMRPVKSMGWDNLLYIEFQDSYPPWRHGSS
jgi:hypothetical protein